MSNTVLKSAWTKELSGGYKNNKNPQIAFEVDDEQEIQVVLNRTDNKEPVGMIMFLVKDGTYLLYCIEVFIFENLIISIISNYFYFLHL